MVRAPRLDLHRDRAFADGDVVRPKGPHGRQPRRATGRHVEARAVARTFDFAADEFALFERTAVVRALVVDRIEFAVVVAQGDATAAGFDDPHRADRHVFNAGDRDQFRHEGQCAPSRSTCGATILARSAVTRSSPTLWNTSWNNPSTISREAVSVSSPRLRR